MTRDEIINTLVAIERVLNTRIVVWRTLIDADGRVLRRVVRGTYHASHTASRN